MAAKGKPASKAAPDPVVEALQRELKQQGFYAGEIDGVAGQSTRDAVKARDDKAAAETRAKGEAEERELKKLELQQSGRKTDAEAAETARKTKAREERDRLASEPSGVATKIGATTVAFPAGVYAGRAAGLGINKLMDISQESKNKALAGVAADRAAGLTTREGARAAAIRSGAMPSENALMRVGGRMAPHFLLGGMMAGKGGYILSQQDPEGPYYPEMADRAAGLAMVGAGTGIAERGVAYGVAPGVAPDAQAMSVIESNQLRRNNAAGPPARSQSSGPRAVTPGSRADLIKQAKRYNIAGRSTMSVEQLREAVGEAVKSTPAPRGGAATKMLKGLAGPGAAAGIAYAMTPDRAEAGGPADVGRYISSRLVSSGNNLSRVADVYDDYTKFAAARGETPIPLAAFSRQMREGGIGMGRMANENQYMASIRPGDYQAPARGGGPAEALTNAAIAGGAAYGVGRAVDALPAAVGGAMRTAGEAFAPSTIDAMTDYSPDELAQGRNWMARNLPEALQFGAVGEAREMATVPSPSPHRQQPLAAAESLEAPEMDFDTQLADLTSLLQQIGAAPNPMQTAQASRAVTQLPQGFAPSNVPTNRLLAQY